MTEEKILKGLAYIRKVQLNNLIGKDYTNVKTVVSSVNKDVLLTELEFSIVDAFKEINALRMANFKLRNENRKLEQFERKYNLAIKRISESNK